MGKLYSALSENKMVRVFVADSTDIAEQARVFHNTSPVVTAALGRLLTAGAIMGRNLKNEKDLLTLQIRADGPIKTLVVTADNKGNVKGYPGVSQVDLPLKRPGKLDVGSAVGQGILTVIRDTGAKEPYIGKTELVSGEIAEDITYYYAASEQTPTVCALGVLVDTDYTVKHAGGYLIQLLPGADDAVIDQLEKNMKGLPSISSWLADATVEEIAKTLLGPLGVHPMQTDSIQYYCGCSKDKCIDVLSTLSPADLADIIEKDQGTEMNCHFCNRSYTFSTEELKKIFEKK